MDANQTKRNTGRIITVPKDSKLATEIVERDKKVILEQLSRARSYIFIATVPTTKNGKPAAEVSTSGSLGHMLDIIPISTGFETWLNQEKMSIAKLLIEKANEEI